MRMTVFFPLFPDNERWLCQSVLTGWWHARGHTFTNSVFVVLSCYLCCDITCLTFTEKPYAGRAVSLINVAMRVEHTLNTLLPESWCVSLGDKPLYVTILHSTEMKSISLINYIHHSWMMEPQELRSSNTDIFSWPSTRRRLSINSSVNPLMSLWDARCNWVVHVWRCQKPESVSCLLDPTSFCRVPFYALTSKAWCFLYGSEWVNIRVILEPAAPHTDANR